MPTILADSFTTSLARLASDERKQAQLTAFTLMTEPDRPGLQFHRIDTSRDPNFRSVRVSRDICIIVHKTGGSLMLAYVDHHDDAYAWAEPRRIEAHPKTGAIQIVEARERVEEIARPAVPVQAATSWRRPLSRRSSLASTRASSCPSACRRTGSPTSARPSRRPSSRSLPPAHAFELDEDIATERQFLYVAATRARDRLFVSGVAPGSERLDDLQSPARGA